MAYRQILVFRSSAYMRTGKSRYIVQKAVFYLIHFPPHLSAFGHRAILILEDVDMASGLLVEQTGSFQIHFWRKVGIDNTRFDLP